MDKGKVGVGGGGGGGERERKKFLLLDWLAYSPFVIFEE